MTRFARRGPENKKKHEATDWGSLKEGLQKQKAKRNKSDSDSNAKYKKSWPKIKGKKITAEEHLLATAFKKEQRREQRRVKRITERAAKQVYTPSFLDQSHLCAMIFILNVLGGVVDNL